MISIHDNATINLTSNSLLISASLATSDVTLCMDSDQTGVTAGGEITDQMSTSPSWAGSGSFQAAGGIAEWHAYPLNYGFIAPNGTIMRRGVNETTAVLYISNATFTVTHYNIYYSWKNRWGQCQDKYLGNSTSVALTSIYLDGNSFRMGYGYVPIEYYYIMQNVTENEKKTSLGYLSPGSAIQGGTIWGKTTGYSSAATEMTFINSALKTFAVGLGVALAFISLQAALNGANADASEPLIVDTSLETLNSVLALSDTLLTDFSSISFSTDSNFGAFLYSITSGDSYMGYSYSLADYQSMNPITFTGNGNTYSFYGPSNFVVAS